jgi:hypothetical protein
MVSFASGVGGTLYASTFDLAGIYRRDVITGDWVGVGMRARDVFGGADLDAGALAASRFTANLLYMARNGIFGRSSDGGATWEAVGTVDPSVTELIWDPTNDQIGFARTSAALRKTVDGGATWAVVSGFTGQPRGLVINEQRPNELHLLVASDAAGIVWHSEDGGSSWSPASSGLPAAGGEAIAAMPGSATTLYVVVAGELYRSIDAGASWALAYTPGAPARVTSVSFDRAAPSVVYVTQTGSGAARSVDSGAHWESLGLPLSFPDSGPAWIAAVPGEAGLLTASVLNEGLFEMQLRPELHLVATSQMQTGALWNVALELTNRGPFSISAARLQAVLPEASGAYSITGTNCMIASRQLTCDVGSLGVNQAATAIVTFTPSQSGTWMASAAAYESNAVTANYSISLQSAAPAAQGRNGGRLDATLLIALLIVFVGRASLLQLKRR